MVHRVKQTKCRPDMTLLTAPVDLAALHTLRDVVHYVLAGDEDPLMDTQLKRKAVFQHLA